MPLNKKGTGTIKGYKIGPGVNLSAAVLPNTSLKGADLRGANLRNAELAHSDLSNADLTGADLRGANLEGAKLHDTIIDDADFTGANLRKACIYKAGTHDKDGHGNYISERPNFHDADLSGATIKYTEFMFPDFSEADAERAKIDQSYFRGPDMRDADFSKSRWAGSRGSAGGISQGYLGDSRGSKDADLRGANFTNSKFIDYSIRNADLEDADFSDSKFENVSFSDNNYKNTKFDRSHFGPNKLKKMHGHLDQRASSFGDYDVDTSGRHGSIKQASFKDATFELLPKGGGFKFNDLTVMPDSMYKVLKPEIEKERAEIDEIIKNHPNYMGEIDGLWMHMTPAPFMEISRTELSVSPYRPGETYYNQWGDSIYGLVFRGRAHLFDLDVNTRNGLSHFGYMVPKHAGVRGNTDMIHKEALLDMDSAEFVGLEIDKSILDEFVKRGPDYAYSLNKYKEFIERIKAAKIPIKYVKKEADRGKVTDWVKGAKRKKNPECCCICDQPASLMSDRGDVFCEDCF
jgi:uncharacterized protein YjbI with pentapeptide repeats